MMALDDALGSIAGSALPGSWRKALAYKAVEFAMCQRPRQQDSDTGAALLVHEEA